MNTLKYSFFFTLALIISCTKPPDYSDVPEIEFVSFSKSVLQMATGSSNDDFTYLTISFTDGDGDLGGGDTSTVFFIDDRTGSDFLTFEAALIPEQGAGNGISGEMIVTLPTTCCIHPDPLYSSDGCGAPFEATGVDSDTVTYDVYILDRAGNKSNVITIAPLTILCH